MKAPLTLNVQVWDKDTFRPDDFLGQFDMVLNGSDKPTELDQWFPLEGRGKARTLHFRAFPCKLPHKFRTRMQS